MNVLEEWTRQVCAELGLDPERAAQDGTAAVLDLAREVAHQVARPAAPLTAYLVGVAVGQGTTREDACAAVARLTASWPPPG